MDDGALLLKKISQRIEHRTFSRFFSGRKMFSATDKMANVLKPLQLLEMKLGPTEIKYHEQKQNLVKLSLHVQLKYCQNAKNSNAVRIRIFLVLGVFFNIAEFALDCKFGHWKRTCKLILTKARSCLKLHFHVSPHSH